LIAARTLGLPACYVGSGFTVPPKVSPFPSFRPQMKIAEQILAHNDAEVLKELNAALARLKLAPLDTLQDVLGAAHPALLSYRPLDHYERPRPEPFLGMPDYSHGAAPRWPDGTGPKIFAYLRPSASLVPALKAIKKSPARVLLRLSGAAPADVTDHLRPGMDIVTGPVSFKLAAESCDGFVNYGAHSTVCEFLLAGKPGLLVPDLHERVLTSRRAMQMGACTGARGTEDAPYEKAMEVLLNDGALKAAAEKFAKDAGAIDRDAIIPKLVSEFVV
jgi:UDP:flavonoid glycosyltransferase YjiC (YdhE family)